VDGVALFTDSTGSEFPIGTPIPRSAKANFYIINVELRKTIHRERLRVGTRFHLREGGKKVAACEVTKLLGLHANAA
jgi:translation elongation factor EF-Tu-like GTPase